MAELWGRAGGANRKLRELYARDGGANRKLKEMWAREGGVGRKIFSAGAYMSGTPSFLSKDVGTGKYANWHMTPYYEAQAGGLLVRMSATGTGEKVSGRYFMNAMSFGVFIPIHLEDFSYINSLSVNEEIRTSFQNSTNYVYPINGGWDEYEEHVIITACFQGPNFANSDGNYVCTYIDGSTNYGDALKFPNQSDDDFSHYFYLPSGSSLYIGHAATPNFYLCYYWSTGIHSSDSSSFAFQNTVLLPQNAIIITDDAGNHFPISF